MNAEKEILKQDLNKQEKPEDIKKFIEDIELMGRHEDIVELAKAKYETAIKQTNTPIETTEGQKTRVENLGGNETELQEVTTPIDEKIAEKDHEIKNVEKETEQKIGEVKNENKESNSEFKYDSEEGRTLRNSLKGMSNGEFLKVMDKYPHSVSINNDNTRSLWADIIRENKLSPEELIEIDKKVNDKEGYNDEVIVGRILETGKLPLDKALEIISRGGGPRLMETFVEKTNFLNMNDTELKKVFKTLDKVGNWHFNEIVGKSGRTKEQIQALLKQK